MLFRSTFFIFYALSEVLGGKVISDGGDFLGNGVFWGGGVNLSGGDILCGGGVLGGGDFLGGGVILIGGDVLSGSDIFHFLCFIKSFGWQSHFGCRRLFG